MSTKVTIFGIECTPAVVPFCYCMIPTTAGELRMSGVEIPADIPDSTPATAEMEWDGDTCQE